MAKKERLIQGEKVQRRVRAFVRCLDLPTVAAAQPRCPATLEWVLFLLTIVAPVNNSVVKYGAEFAASCLGGPRTEAESIQGGRRMGCATWLALLSRWAVATVSVWTSVDPSILQSQKIVSETRTMVRDIHDRALLFVTSSLSTEDGHDQ